MDQRYCLRLATVAVLSSSAQFSTGTGLYRSTDIYVGIGVQIHRYRSKDTQV
jgi:hypothetical protein